MKEIIIRTQKELDALKDIKEDEWVSIESSGLRLKGILDVWGVLIFKFDVDMNFYEQRFIRENSSPSIVSWENSSPSIVSRENSSPSIVSWENSIIRGIQLSVKATLKLFAFSMAVLPFGLKLKITKSKTSKIQYVKELDFWEKHGLSKTAKTIVLYKRVSKDFKTQENTERETLWAIGSTVTHKAWGPTTEECGGGKFHACPQPYFCDEFRSTINDKYIAVMIKKIDVFVWTKNPQYPYKVGFREGKVLFECDRFGEKLEGK